MADILQQIMIHKRTEVAAARTRVSEAELQRQIRVAPPVRDFAAALRRSHPMGLIAEVKRASPSAGLIREDFSATEVARTYAENGAACISVLTDEKYFQGHLDYLRQIRNMVDVPLLRKDFILDRYQILEARAAGADCVLLIAECLDDVQLADLYQTATGLGMQALVELHDAVNLDGGGSVTLVEENAESGKGQLLNVPSDRAQGRAVASSLAIFARRPE